MVNVWPITRCRPPPEGMGGSSFWIDLWELYSWLPEKKICYIISRALTQTKRWPWHEISQPHFSDREVGVFYSNWIWASIWHYFLWQNMAEHEPAYIGAYQKGLLKEKAAQAADLLKSCMLCQQLRVPMLYPQKINQRKAQVSNQWGFGWIEKCPFYFSSDHSWYFYLLSWDFRLIRQLAIVRKWYVHQYWRYDNLVRENTEVMPGHLCFCWG